MRCVPSDSDTLQEAQRFLRSLFLCTAANTLSFMHWFTQNKFKIISILFDFYLTIWRVEWRQIEKSQLLCLNNLQASSIVHAMHLRVGFQVITNPILYMILMLHCVVGPLICIRLQRLLIQKNLNIDNCSRHKSFVELFGLGGPWSEAGWWSDSSLEQNPLLKDAACKGGGNFGFSGALESCDIDEVETSALIGRQRCLSIHFLHFLSSFCFLACAWTVNTSKATKVVQVKP